MTLYNEFFFLLIILTLALHCTIFENMMYRSSVFFQTGPSIPVGGRGHVQTMLK